MAVKHAFTSPKADSGDASLVRPSNWNANHTVDPVTRYLFIRAVDLTAREQAVAAAGFGTPPNGYSAMLLPNGVSSTAETIFEVPGDLSPLAALNITPVWCAAAQDATPHTVRWSIVTKELAAGIDATVTGTTVTWTGASASRPQNATVYDTSAATVVPAATGNLIMLGLRRIGADAADTFAQDVRLIGIRIGYTANPVA